MVFNKLQTLVGTVATIADRYYGGFGDMLEAVKLLSKHAPDPLGLVSQGGVFP